MTTAAEKWQHDLASWAIPDEIINQAPESPWIHPPALFDLPEVITPSPSHHRAREALGDEASVVDVGCGGGIATFALLPEVRRAVGVDHQAAMLDLYRRNGDRLGLPVETVLGDWPAVAARVPVADVVVVHHVGYNVGDIVPFLEALHGHARHRVVLELPMTHPLSTMSEAWRHFWQLERPVGPTPDDLCAVISGLGWMPRIETWQGPMRTEQNLDEAAHFMRIRLCLPVDRESEVRDFLANQKVSGHRDLATIWWDVTD